MCSTRRQKKRKTSTVHVNIHRSSCVLDARNTILKLKKGGLLVKQWGGVRVDEHSKTAYYADSSKVETVPGDIAINVRTQVRLGLIHKRHDSY